MNTENQTESKKPEGNENAVAAAPQAKPKAKPRKRPNKKGPEAARISYNDRHKLSVQGRDNENFVYRIVNTDDAKNVGRVELMQQRGYILCNDEESLGDQHGTEASKIGTTIGKPVGNGVRGVLMKIPKEYYEQDKAMKQAEVDDTEKGMVDDDLHNDENIYGEGLKVDDKRGSRLEVRTR